MLTSDYSFVRAGELTNHSACCCAERLTLSFTKKKDIALAFCYVCVNSVLAPRDVMLYHILSPILNCSRGFSSNLS